MPTVNGREYQHATLKVAVQGKGSTYRFNTFQKLMWKVTTEKKPVRDSQGQVIGYTIGEAQNEGAIAMLRSDWLAFKEWAATQFPDLGVGQMEFDLNLTYGNATANLKTDRLFGVMFQSEGLDSQNNQDPHSIDIPLFVLRVDPHGGAFVKYV